MQGQNPNTLITTINNDQNNANDPLSNLIELCNRHWNEQKSKHNEEDIFFSPTRFDDEGELNKFISLLKEYTDMHRKNDIDYENHLGFINKFDLPLDGKICMRADLRGGCRSLIVFLNALVTSGLLDQNFKCNQDCHIVFLGDYCDRGYCGTQILEMLIMLSLKNPGQVHLIRGNNEYIEINEEFGSDDICLTKVIKEDKAALNDFYEALPLSTYMSIDKFEGPKRYIQFTNGLFDLAADPSILLDEKQSREYVPILINRSKASDRIVQISKDDTHPQQRQAMRIVNLVKEHFDTCDDKKISGYNWFHIAEKDTDIHGLYTKINASDINDYLELSAVINSVKIIFRGHFHKHSVCQYENKIIAETMTVGISTHRGYRVIHDVAYIITNENGELRKRLLCKKTGDSMMHTSIGTKDINDIFYNAEEYRKLNLNN